MSKQIEVVFTVDVDESAKSEDVSEWLEFELGARGNMRRCNPLAGDIDAYDVEFKEI